jgi:hypothetical protein
LTRSYTEGVFFSILLGVLDSEFGDRRDGARLERLFDFVYADHAPMQTFGGIVSAPGLEQVIRDQCRFADLPFVRLRGQDAMEIRVPVLTRREALHLNAQLPLSGGAVLTAEGITDEELAAYELLYRWYPQ